MKSKSPFPQTIPSFAGNNISVEIKFLARLGPGMSDIGLQTDHTISETRQEIIRCGNSNI